MKNKKHKVELSYYMTRTYVKITAYEFANRFICVELIESGKFKGQYEVFTQGGSYGIKKMFGAAIAYAEKQLTDNIINNEIADMITEQNKA